MYTDSSSIEGDSAIIQIHPATINLPLEGKTKGIHDCELKTHIQEDKCIKTKENRQAETNFTPIRHY